MNKTYIIQITSILIILIPLILLLLCSYRTKQSNILENNIQEHLSNLNSESESKSESKSESNTFDNYAYLNNFNNNNIIENFSLKDMFNKPNNNIKIDDSPIQNENNLSTSFKGTQLPMELPNGMQSNTLQNGLPTGTIESNLEAQYLNSLNKKDVPVINAKPQSMITQEIERNDFQKKFQCQFFSDKCPEGYSENGSFSLAGFGDGTSITCGDSLLKKKCVAVAEVKDSKLKKIHIIDSGLGYQVDTPPIVKIISRNGMGSNANAECIVDDEGKVQYINVINGGDGYIETPLIEISDNNSTKSCHLCCK